MKDGVKEFPLMEWEFFEAQIDTDGTRGLVRHVRTVTKDGHVRIFGDGMLDEFHGFTNAWLNPNVVPARVIRGDSHYPRLSDLEWREIIRAGRERCQSQVDERKIIPPDEEPERAATLEDMSSAPKALGRKAHKLGFDLRCFYAKKPRVDQYGNFLYQARQIIIAGKHPDGRQFGCLWVEKVGVRGKSLGKLKWELDACFVRRPGRWSACTADERDAYLSTVTN